MLREDHEEEQQIYVLIPPKHIQTARGLLDSWGFLKKSVSFLKEKDGLQNRVGIPLNDNKYGDPRSVLKQLQIELKHNLEEHQIELLLSREKAPLRRTKVPPSPREECLNKIKAIMNGSWSSDLEDEIPRHWEKHSDLALLPFNSFRNEVFSEHMEAIIDIMCNTLRVARIARKSRISSDDFRSPRVVFLTPTSKVWTERIENGIIYRWDVTKSMFSVGNITEKLRISDFSCKNEVVVDLFAGIGYFSLPYLVKARAKHLIACEWNPKAVEALHINLEANKVDKARYTILFGDNREVCPENVADRVNLGLIPSSELSWKTACRALKTKTGGVLHIHANVDSSNSSSTDEALNLWATETKEKIGSILGNDWTSDILHIEKVKSYGPKIYHVVLDLRCLPINP